MLPVITIMLLYLGFIFLIRYNIRNRQISLTKAEIALALGAKIAISCLYGYIFLLYYGGDDTWQLQRDSLDEYNKLLHQPGAFFRDFLPMSAFRYSRDFWQGIQYYIMDLENLSIPKLFAFFNIISRGNYYVNATCFNFILFWGHYWLFSLLVRVFPQKRYGLLLLIFFFPPVLFWLSGVRTDGLLFLFTALLLRSAWRWIQQGHKASLLYTLLALAGIFIFRNVLVLLLLPALLSWWLVVRKNRLPLPVFGIVYSITILIFFITPLLSASYNLPAIVVSRQHEFMQLPGRTRLPLDTLRPDLASFATVLHQAAANTFLRPWLWEAKGVLQIMTASDILLFWLFAIFVLFRLDTNACQYWKQPLLWVLLCFSMTLYLFIGYTVPFPGAIVRYKVIPELFLLTLLVMNMKVKERNL